HLDVVLSGELEESLEPRAGVLRTLPLVAVREKEHEARRLAPFVLRRRHELVDDDLRPVPEVSELRLPQHKRRTVAERVAVLEPDHGELAQQRVVDEELRARAVEVLQRNVLVAGLLIDDDRVPLAERAPARVFAGQTDRLALQ